MGTSHTHSQFLWSHITERTVWNVATVRMHEKPVDDPHKFVRSGANWCKDTFLRFEDVLTWPVAQSFMNLPYKDTAIVGKWHSR